MPVDAWSLVDVHYAEHATRLINFIQEAALADAHAKEFLAEADDPSRFNKLPLLLCTGE